VVVYENLKKDTHFNIQEKILYTTVLSMSQRVCAICLIFYVRR